MSVAELIDEKLDTLLVSGEADDALRWPDLRQTKKGSSGFCKELLEKFQIELLMRPKSMKQKLWPKNSLSLLKSPSNLIGV